MEAPLLVLPARRAHPAGVHQAVSELSELQLKQFFALADSEVPESVEPLEFTEVKEKKRKLDEPSSPERSDVASGNFEKTAFGVFSTNALPCGPPSNLGIFVLAARLNHSCDHNVRHMWDEALQQLVIRAVRDIKAKEELCTNYLEEGGFSLTRSERQALLLRKFRFQCDCHFCSLEGAHAQASDERRVELARPSTGAARRWELLCQEHITDPGVLGHAAFQLWQTFADDPKQAEQARCWLRQCVEYFSLAEGDSVAVRDLKDLLCE